MAFHQYNTFLYNVSQYNADAYIWLARLSDSVGSADALLPNSLLKALAESLTPTEATKVLDMSKPLTDFILATDAISKSLSNKGLSDTVRLNDWCEIERKTDSSTWGN